MGDTKKIIIEGKNLPTKQGATRAERSATVTSTIDHKSIRELAVAVKEAEKIKKDEFDFAKLFSKLERKLSTLFTEHFKATGHPEGISKADISRIIKEVVQVSLVDIISKVFEKQAKKGKAAGELKSSTITSAIEKGLAKISINVAKEVGRASKGDVTMNPTLFAGSLKSVITPLIPKSLPQASLGVEKSFSTVKKLMRELDLLSKSITSMRQSGGGIDLMELPKVIANLKQVGENAVSLGKALVQTKKDASDVYGESSEKIKELNAAIINVKKTVGEKVAGVRRGASEDRSAITKTVFSEITKILRSSAIKDTELARVIKSFENKINVMADLGPALKAIGAEFKGVISGGAGIKNADELIKKFDNLLFQLNSLPDKLDITGTIPKEYKEFLRGMEKLSKGAKKTAVEVKLIIDDSGLRSIQEKGIEVKTDLDITPAKDTLKTLADDSIEVTVDANKRSIDITAQSILKVIQKAVSDAIEEGLKDTSKSKVLGDIGKELNIAVDNSSIIGLQKVINDLEKVLGIKLEQVSKQVGGLLEHKESKAAGLRGVSTTKPRGLGTTKAPKYDLEMLKSTIGIPSYKEKVIGTQGIESIKEVSEQGFKTRITDLNRQLLAESEKNMNDLSVSLGKLQKGIIDRLDNSFKEFDTGWEVSRPQGEQDPSKIFKKTDRQWTVDIVNVDRLQRMFKDVRGGPQALTGAYITDKMAKTDISMEPRQMADAIGRWLKQTSESQIKSWEVDIKDVAPQLIKIQKSIKGVAPDEGTLDAIVGAFGTNLESIFKNTYQRSEAKRMMQNEKLIRTISLPVATLTKEGAPTFQTTHGSLRALPKFAQFTSGFEDLYARLEKSKALDFSKEYSGGIKEVGVRPTGRKLYLAEGIATSMLKDLAAVSQESKNFILGQFKEAGVMRGVEVARTGQFKGPEFGTEAKLFSLSIDKMVDAFAVSGVDEIDTLVASLKKMGVSAHDLVRSLDQVSFENVYDIYKKILVPETGGPVAQLAEQPYFDKSIRDLEQAVGQLAGLFPLVERNRPRRAVHQSNIVNMLTRTGSMYDIKDTLKPAEQKDLIKNLNLRLGEMVEEAKTLQSLSMGKSTRLRRLPVGVSALSSLGVPEEQASKIEEYREGSFKEGVKFLKDLNATAIKMYSDILPELAPFGAEFQQIGRNITNVTNAMIDTTRGAEFPKLTTQKERGVVESGFYGKKGYGFNVVAELRNTASTFEDQVVVSGKLADAVTSAVKMLVTPSPGGRVGAPVSETFGKVAEDMEIKAGQLLKSNIQEAKREFQTILGIPQRYEGRADAAFVESVEKVLTVVRGESIEVQQAKIAETFLNYFGRKFTTRYGSKGVGVMPTMPAGQTLREAYEKYGAKDVQVLTSKEQEKAGLGVARLPKSMGELVSEIMEENVSKLKSKGYADVDIEESKDLLIESGNKFLLDIFKDASKGIVSTTEASKSQKVFEKYKGIMGALYDDSSIVDQFKEIATLKDRWEIALKEQAKFYKEVPIDIRISSHGLAKRGLQTEILETVMNNIVGVGAGQTVMSTKMGKEVYSGLLGVSGERGLLSKYSEALGFKGTAKAPEMITRETMGPRKYEEAKGLKKALEMEPGKELGAEATKLVSEYDKVLRAAVLESTSSYYSDIIDEVGEKRKSLVGEKFVQIIQEPHYNPEWAVGQVEKGIKGERLNIPAYSAYATIFGENSAMMKEVHSSITLGAKKHWEYLKALQFLNKESTDLVENLTVGLDRVDIGKISGFDFSTGIYDKTGAAVRSFKDTVMDIEKYPSPFVLDLPTAKKDVREEFYVPGALAREAYPEPLLAGERGLSDISRRLSHVVNMAKELEKVLEEPEGAVPGSEVQRALPNIIPQMIKPFYEGVKGVKAGTVTQEAEEAMEVAAEMLINKWYRAFSNVRGTKVEQILTGGFQGTEKEYISGFLEKQMSKVRSGEKPKLSAYATTLGKMSDLLVGVSPGTARNFPERGKASKMMEKYISIGKGGEFAQTLGVDLSENEIRKSVENLEKAKIDYYSALAKTALGKKGSVEEVLFTRKIPAVMGIAVTAVVDKTDDLRKFAKELERLEVELGTSLKAEKDALSEVIATHQTTISAHKERIGVPVLKQHELGIPVSFAKKVPVEFEKKYTTDLGSETAPEKIKGSLLDLLRYADALAEALKSPGIDKSKADEIKNYIQNELVPFVESVRFPFTGVSSVQPYKAKLVEDMGKSAENVLMVPGLPELDFDKFKFVIESLEDRIEGLVGQREKAISDPTVENLLAVAKLTKTINMMDKAISETIPKYVAQQQKLDFDGDQIEIHAAKTKQARLEIAKHLQHIKGTELTTERAFRDKFSYGAMVGSTGEFPLAEMSIGFEKKFPKEKGFDFLKAPFLTKELEYLSPQESLKMLSERKGTDPTVALSEAIKDLVRNDEAVTFFSEEISKIGMGKTADEILSASKVISENIEGIDEKIIQSAIKAQVYDERYKDAIEAQLYKIHTGADTEALYRLHRVAELNIGFGKGQIGTGGYKASSSFLEKFPASYEKVTGAPPAKEFHTMINEMVRFAIQKGMDVKHAGETPVAGKMVRFIAKGREGVEELWKDIVDESNSSYSELRDFYKVNEKVIRRRTGAMDINELTSALLEVYDVEGLEGRELQGAGRIELVDKIVEQFGLKGFLNRLSDILYEEAVNGLILKAEKFSPKKRSKLGIRGDIKSWAEGYVTKQMGKDRGIDIRELITEGQQPLYAMRTSMASPTQELDKFKAQFGDIPIPEFPVEAFGSKFMSGYESKYQKAKATAKNIQRELELAASSSQAGAYADMIEATSRVMAGEQVKIESIISSLGEGYDIEAEAIKPLAERAVKHLETFPEFIKNILAIQDEVKRSKAIEDLSKLAGVSQITSTEESFMRYDLSAAIGKKVESLLLCEGAISRTQTGDEEFKKDMEEKGNELVERALDIHKIDIALRALSKKVYEGRFLSEFLPSAGVAISSTKMTEAQKATISASKAEITRAKYGPESPGRLVRPEGVASARDIGGGVAGAPPPSLTFDSGDVLSVRVVAVDSGVVIGVSGAEGRALVGAATATGVTDLDIDPELQKKFDMLGEADKVHASLFKKLRSQESPTFGKDYVSLFERFTAGGLQTGGKFGAMTDFDPEKAFQSQIEAITDLIMKRMPEPDEALKLYSSLGIALHEKIQRRMEKEASSAGTGKKFKFEKLVDDIETRAGPISGFADIVEYTGDPFGKETIKKVSDIKTAGKFDIEKLQKAAGGVKRASYDELIKKIEDPKIRAKLETAVSQVNVYLKGLSEYAQGEVLFFDRLKKGEDEPFVVEFGYSEERFQKDIDALMRAREGASKELAKADIGVTKGIIPKGTKSTVTREYMEKAEKYRSGITDEELNTLVDTVIALLKKEQETSRPRAVPSKKDIGQSKLVKERIAKKREAEERAKAYGRGDYETHIDPIPIAAGEGIKSVLENLRSLHEQAKLYQQVKLLDFTALEAFDESIKEAMRQVGEEGAVGGVLIEAIDAFNDAIEDPTQGIKGKDIGKLWKLYRMSRGEWLLNRAEQAKKDLDAAKEAGETREADRAYGTLQRAVKEMQKFVVGSLGKMSDIYTEDKRFVHPKLARHAGVYKDPRQIALSEAGPLGESDKLEKIFRDMTRDLGQGRELVSPLVKIRAAFKELTALRGKEGADPKLQEKMVGILTDAEKLKRVGPEVMEAWDFSELADDVAKLKAAMDMIAKYNEFDAQSRSNLEFMRKYLKGLESTYSHLNLKMRQTAQTQEDVGKSGLFSPRIQKEWGQLDLMPVSKFEAPTQQLALHERNIQKVREYFKTPEEMGGPKEDERFSYSVKVIGDTGEVIKNVIIGFRKYGEVVDESGAVVGQFAERQKDMIEWMQRSNASFKNAVRRVVMWGAASRLVYGGIAKLKSSLTEISAIEVSLAQLRMVMSPLETDFVKLQKSAVGFAKTYGIGVNDVLKSMKVFAQQGLSQAEVIDRTRVATLAANVTTLTSKDATEALTASMKVFKEEGSSALRFLDAWSETEAKHAITAADMANAIKKSAAAAKTAGVSFDELNGIVAAIGSVTRQSGKEVGTSMRFIFRRLFSEKGPKALAKIGIPAITGEGELRRGFDVLNDLAGQWKDLTQAQKLNIAQSIGGTRQYNALIVLMDQWDEALRGIRNSTNSKGSAERRNLEIMKTYAKQLEQTKAAVTELKMEFGKIVLPTFKAGAKALRMVLETVNAIPTPVKAAVAAIGSLFVLGARGFGVFDSISEFIGRGKTELSGFGKEFSKQMKIAKFELTGKGAGDDIFGLKTALPSANKMANLNKLPGVDTVGMGKKWSDFHSIVGASVFKLRDWGLSYNKFLGDFGGKTGKVLKSSGDALQDFAKTLDKYDWKISAGVQLGALFTPGMFDDILAGMVTVGTEAAEKTSKYLGKALSFTGKTFGKGAELWLKSFADENTNLVKALLPLGATVAAGAMAVSKLSDKFAAATKSAQDFEKTMYGARRESGSELKVIRELSQQYEILSKKVEEVNKASKPETKVRRQELGTYEAPLKTMRGMQRELIDLSNSLADQNLSLISGYDKLGNAVLRSSTNFGYFLKEIDKVKVQDALETEIKVINQYVRALTDVGSSEKIKRAFKDLTSSMPVVGGLISKKINVSPALVLEEAAEELNRLVNIKNKYPLSTAVDEDIKILQTKMTKARNVFKETYSDLSRVFSDAFSKAGLKGLDKSELEDLFTRPELLEVFKVMVEIDPEFSLVKGIKPEDLMAKELLQVIYPQVAGVLDADKLFTIANFESMGKKVADGLKRGSRGIATFKFEKKILDTVWEKEELAKNLQIAGAQAVLEFKQTTDGVYDWIATYFNTKTLQIEEVPFSEISKFADAIFPLDNIKEDLTYRMDALNTFVSGAAAGLTGISVKDFKKDFDLGARFFSQISTPLLLQGSKGFTPQEAPGSRYGEVKGMEKWGEEIKRFHFKPMGDLKLRLESVSKLQEQGLEGGVTLTAEFHSEVQKLLTTLKNNQVVFQFRALFVDLMKEFSEGEHILRQNLAVQEMRNKLDLETGGLMAGTPKALLTSDLGTRDFSELSSHQRLLLSDKKYKSKEFEIRKLETTLQSNLEMADKVEKALVDLADIEDIAKGFDVVLDPSQMSEFVEQVSKVADPGKFEKLIDINQNVATNTKDAVAKLDELIENIGTPESVDRIMKKSFTDSVQPMGKTITRMERVAKVRAKAEGRGDSETIISANKALDVLSKRLLKEKGLEGAVKAVKLSAPLSGRVDVAEFQQRLFAGMKPETFFKKMGKYGVERPETLRRFSREAFTGSETLEDLKELQQKSHKQGLLSARNIATASASLATFTIFEKHARNKNIDKLDEQIKNQDKLILKIRESGKEPSKQEEEIRGLVKERIALVSEKKKIQKKVDFYGLVSSMSMLEAGTTQLAMAMGLSEGQVKALGVGALGTYAAVKFAASMLKEDLPDSVDEFGAKLKEIGVSIATKEKPDLGGLKSLGKTMVKDIEKRRRDVTGLTGKEIEKRTSEVDVEALRRKYQQDFGDLSAVAKRIKESAAPGKDYSEEVKNQFNREIESIGERIRKEGVGGPGTKRLQQTLAVFATATFSDYLAGMFDKKVLTSTLEKATKEQAELTSKIFSKWGDSAEKALLEMYTDIDKATPKVGKLSTTTRSTVLNVEENAEEIKEAIEKFGRKVEEASKVAQKRLKESKIDQAIKNAFMMDRKVIDDLIGEFSDYMISSDVAKQFGGPSLLNKALEGFMGDVELPVSKRGMSTQQRVFADADKNLQNVIGSVGIVTKKIELLSKDLEYLQKEAYKEELFVERGVGDSYAIKEAKGRYKELQKEIKKRNEVLKKERDILRNISYPTNQLNEFSKVMHVFSDSLQDLSFTEAVDGMASFKASIEGYSRLFGGAHPLAPTAVSVEQQYQGAKVGVPLQHMISNRYEIQRMELLTRQQTASGEELAKIARELRTQPQQIQRDVMASEQRTEIEKLSRQRQIFETQLRGLEGYKATPGLPYKAITKTTELQEKIGSMLDRSRKETTGSALLKELERNRSILTDVEYEVAKANYEKAGLGKQFRGFPIWEQKELGLDSKEVTSVIEAGFKNATNANDKSLEAIVRNPIVERLDKLVDAAQSFGKEFGVDFTDPEKQDSKWHDRGIAGFIKALYSYLPKYKTDDKDSSGFSRWTGFQTAEKASGGRVFGEGGPKADKIPAMLSSGEYVIRASSAQKLGQANLEHMNKKGEIPGFASGGKVTRMKIGKQGESTPYGYFESLSKDLEEMRSVAKKLRLEGADEVAEAIESGKFTGVPLKQAGLASFEMLSSPVKGLLDAFSMAEKTGKYLKKTSMSDIFKDVGTGIKSIPGVAKGLIEQVKSGALTEAFKGEVASGGTGLSGLAFEMAIPGGLALKGVKKASKLTKVQNVLNELSELYPTNIKRNLKDVSIAKELEVGGGGSYYPSKKAIVLEDKPNMFRYVPHEYGHFLGDVDYDLWKTLSVKSSPSEHELGFIQLYTNYMETINSLRKASSEKYFGLKEILSNITSGKSSLGKGISDAKYRLSGFKKDVPSDYAYRRYPTDPENIGMYSEMLSTGMEWSKKGSFGEAKSVKLTEDYLKNRFKYKDLIEGHDVHKIDDILESKKEKFISQRRVPFKRAKFRQTLKDDIIKIQNDIDKGEDKTLSLYRQQRLKKEKERTLRIRKRSLSDLESEMGLDGVAGKVGGSIKEAKTLFKGAVFELGSSRYTNPHAQAILASKHSDDILKQIPKGTKILDQTGAESIVLDLPGGKEVMRIGNLLPERPDIPSVLQASKRKVYGDIQVETVPRVKTEGITDTDVDFMKRKLEGTDYEFSDPRRGNLGRTKDGELTILDPGAVRKREAPVMIKSFAQTTSPVFDPDEAGRALRVLLGEAPVKATKKSLTGKGLLDFLDNMKTDITGRALEMGKLLKESPENLKVFEKVRKATIEKYKEIQSQTRKGGASMSMWDEYSMYGSRNQFFNEADDTMQVLLDPTTNNALSKVINERLEGGSKIGNFMDNVKFAEGGTIEREKKSLLERLREKYFGKPEEAPLGTGLLSDTKKKVLKRSERYKEFEKALGFAEGGSIQQKAPGTYRKYKTGEGWTTHSYEDLEKSFGGLRSFVAYGDAETRAVTEKMPDMNYVPRSKSLISSTKYKEEAESYESGQEELLDSILKGTVAQGQIGSLRPESQSIAQNYGYFKNILDNFGVYSKLETKRSGLTGEDLEDHLINKKIEFENAKTAAASLLEMPMEYKVSTTGERFTGQAREFRRGPAAKFPGKDVWAIKEQKLKDETGLTDPYLSRKVAKDKYFEYKRLLEGARVERPTSGMEKTFVAEKEKLRKELEGLTETAKKSGKIKTSTLISIREEGAKRSEIQLAEYKRKAVGTDDRGLMARIKEFFGIGRSKEESKEKIAEVKQQEGIKTKSGGLWEWIKSINKYSYSLGGPAVNQRESASVKHFGGPLTKTGYFFGEKGEYVVPKGQALGGFPDNKLVTESLNTGTKDIIKVVLEEGQTVEAKVDGPLPVDRTPLLVKETELSIKGIENGILKIDVPGSIPVTGIPDGGIPVNMPTGGIDVVIDTSGIERAIESAMGGVNAVGADEIDTLSRAVANVNEKIINVRTEFNTKIEMVTSTPENSNIDIKLGEAVDSINSGMTKMSNEVNTSIASINSDRDREKQTMDYRLEELARKLASAMNRVGALL